MNLYVLEKYKDDGRDSRTLFLEALKLYSEEFGLNLPYSPEISRTEEGKPYFKEIEDIHFSISHSENLWICGFAKNNIGIDLQFQKKVKGRKIAERYFPKKDCEYILNHGDRGFFEVWTVKEALTKFLGKTLATVMGKYSVSTGKDLLNFMMVEGEEVYCNTVDLNSVVSACPGRCRTEDGPAKQTLDNESSIRMEKYPIYAYVSEKEKEICIKKMK